MRGVYVLALVALCAQQALGFKMHSIELELNDDVDEDIVGALHLNTEKDIDLEDIDKEDIDKDIDKEDIDKKDIDKEDIDKDDDTAETDEEDDDEEEETEVEDSRPLGKKCRKRFRPCQKSRHCCGHLLCLKYKFIRMCI